jgi:hypothetical protein
MGAAPARCRADAAPAEMWTAGHGHPDAIARQVVHDGLDARDLAAYLEEPAAAAARLARAASAGRRDVEHDVLSTTRSSSTTSSGD